MSAEEQISQLVHKYDIQALASLDVDKYVRKATGKCEENVKIKIVIPLLQLLGYNSQQDMDFEHHVRNKKADIALLFDNKPRLLIEVKDLDENLDNHIHQALDYAFNKGVEWVILTNGLEIRVYKSFIQYIPSEDRLIFTATLSNLPQSFNPLFELVSKEHLQEAKKLTEKAESIRENITTKILIEDLAECRKRLANDLFVQFKARYETDSEFKEIIDTWATDVKMNISDPGLIEKLCREGAYTLINRVLFLRICEDKGHVKAKLSRSAIAKWREMVEDPSKMLGMAFEEIGQSFEGLYKSPLFDSINFEDIEWNADTINFVLDKLGAHDFSKISKDILGRAYEQHISRKERKELGQFYTPDFVIDYILDQVEISPDKKILDPACGSGGFLMKAYDRLRKQYLEQGWAENKIHSQILEKNLFGIDINPFATQLTVMNLLLKDLDHPTGNINVVEGDTLEKLEEKFDLDIYQVESPLKGITKTDKKLSYGLLLGSRPFDIVVGNPPYISFGTRGTRGADEGKRKYFKFLRKNYPNSAEYKISMYAIFMDRGIELLANSGRFGFIVPDSFLLGRYYSKIRRRILGSCAIKEICLFQKDFWELGIVGLPVVLILQKEKNRKKRLENEVKVCQCTFGSTSSGYVFKTNYYKQKYFEATSFNRFRLFFNTESMDLVQKVESDSYRLDRFVGIHTGIRPRGDRKKVISDSKLGGSWQKGLVSSAEVARYALRYAGRFINIEPKLLWSGGWNRAIVSSHKLLLRRTGDSLLATYDDQAFYHLDNIHSVVSKVSDTHLKYILAILNSKLMNHYYHLISLELGRTMAQLDIETIEQLPIKEASKEGQAGIVALADKMLSLNKQLNDPAFVEQREAIQKEIDATDKEIDQKVYELYGLTEEEKQVIETSVNQS
jgi:type I restriction-modification system DNA methylase subunit/predicted type IV restriction endonuclease